MAFLLIMGVWDIENQKISANYPGHVYSDLTEVDYLVFAKDLKMDFDATNLEEIELDGVISYRVLKNNEPTELKLSFVYLEDADIDISFSNEGNASSFIVSGFQEQEDEGSWMSNEAVSQFEGWIFSDFEIIINRSEFNEDKIEFIFDDVKVVDENVKITESGYQIYIDDSQHNGDMIRHTLKIVNYEEIFSIIQSNEHQDTERFRFFVNEITIRDVK